LPGSHPAWCVALVGVGVGLSLVGLGLAVSGRSDGVAWAEAAREQAAAQAGAPGALVSTTALSDSEVMICVVDTARQRLAVYVADAKKSRLRLLAVRDISADWALTDWNNDPPLPKDVRARVEKGAEAGLPEPAPGGGK
jgi:hypothetical protein